MNIKKITLSVTAIAVAMALSVTSCKKKDNTPEDTDTSGASDNSLAEKTSNDAVNMAGQACDIAVGDSLSSYRYSNDEEDAFGLSCATIGRGDSTNKKITITFNGQQCKDGHVRSGSLIIDYSGSAAGAIHYRNPGFKCVITSNGYTVDGNAITVNKTITNTTASGFNPATTNLTWTIVSSVSIVKANGGGTISWDATKTKTLLNTADSTVYRGQALHIMWNKARVGITGSASGRTASGDSYSATITSQLVRDMNCSPNAAHPGHHPFIQGNADFSPGSKAVRHIDFGSGACDDIAVVTINGKPHTITLP